MRRFTPGLKTGILSPNEIEVDTTLLGCGQRLEVVVGEEFVDGHVDELVLGVVDELDEATGDRLAARHRPHAELLCPPAGGIELVEQLAQLRDGVLSLGLELVERRLSGDRGEPLWRPLLNVDQAGLVEGVDRVVGATAGHVAHRCDVPRGPGPDPEEMDERVRFVLDEPKLLEQVGTLVLELFGCLLAYTGP